MFDKKERMDLEIITALEDEIEADLLSACLDEEGIPYLIQPFSSNAYGPLFMMNWGWGQLLSQGIYAQKILEILEDIRKENQKSFLDQSHDDGPVSTKEE